MSSSSSSSGVSSSSSSSKKEVSMSVARIGVDVGGTHTDAVYAIEKQVIAHHKSKTTSDITEGVVNAVSAVLSQSQAPREGIQSVNIGTTHLVNAFIQGEGMNRVMTLRLAGGATTALPPGSDWPKEACQEIMGEERYILDGGYEYDGREIAPINPKQILWAIWRATDKKIYSVAVVGVFANVNPTQEKLVKRMFNKSNPKIHVTMSHTMGGLGLIPRENGTILNAASIALFQKISRAFKDAFDRLHLPANVYLTYGDGTKSILSEEGTTPLRTFHSGPANSISGAAILAEVKDAITVDVGGTSSDVGVLRNGTPVKENSSFLMTGVGVPCNFELPRMNSFGLGGGSIITLIEGKISIGPKSVGHALYEKALSFGGEVLTVTDIAVALGRLQLGTVSKESVKQKIKERFAIDDPEELIKQIDDQMHRQLASGIKETIAAIEEIPSTLILVGGGALLFDIEKLRRFLPKEFSSIVIPRSSGVANAFGAANSLIGAKFVEVCDYATIPRSLALSKITEKARQIAIEKGALPCTIHVTQIQEVPINYLSGEPHEVSMTVVGDEAPFRGQRAAELAVVEKVEDLAPLFFPKEDMESPAELLCSRPVARTKSPWPRVRELDVLSIGDIARGAGILGSGGGGSPELGHKLALNALQQGGKIELIELEELPDDCFVAGFGVMGSPVVVDERPPAIQEGVEAVRELEKRLGKRIDALVIMEGGGMNCTYPFFVASALGIPLVNGDCMGRAFPGINMVTPNIYGDFQKYVAALSNGRANAFVDEKDCSSLETQARIKTVALGGIVSLAYMPMSGLEAKRTVIKGTLSTAERMGRAIRESEGLPLPKRLEALNQVLKETDYKEARQIFQGTIVQLESSTMSGFNLGGFLIENSKTGEKLWVGYQNENLIAYEPSTKKILAEVPNLITIVDPNNLQSISCGEYRYGQSVAVLTLSAPSMMTTPRALAVVGPSAYPMKQIMGLMKDKK